MSNVLFHVDIKVWRHEVLTRQLVVVCFQQLRVICHDRAVIMVVGAALVDVIAHAWIEYEIHLFLQQAFDVPVAKFSRVAYRVGGYCLLALVVGISCGFL